MTVQLFIDNLKNAFGNIELPVAFWYSDTPKTTPVSVPGCYLKLLKTARDGGVITFDDKTIVNNNPKVVHYNN